MTKPAISHNEAERLLPWFANDTLAEDERRQIELHIESCPACLKDVEILMKIKRAINDPSAVPMVPSPKTQDLMTAIEEYEKPHGGRGQPGWLPLLAACIAVLVLASLLFVARTTETTTVAPYVTVTDSEAVGAVSYILEVRFAEDISNDRRKIIIDSAGASPLSDLNADTVNVLVPVAQGSFAALAVVTGEWLAFPEVVDVTVTAVQLPVRPTE